tara:strand:+ start:426 stop:668 length:243 start_codon:yes stop_codon:yes gene_type:complete
MKSSSLTIVPTYLRDYKSAKAVKKDLLAYRDFRVADVSCDQDGRPGNLLNFIEALGAEGELRVRYNNLRKVVIFKIKELM